MENKKTEIQISFSDEVLKGTYSNNIMISHTRAEFLMDFMTVFHPKGVVGARVIISPNHAKRFMRALQENIRIYETKFGPLAEAEDPTMTPTSIN